MSHEETATHAPAAEGAPYEPIADDRAYAAVTDEWAQESDELPPRPRRRLLGTGRDAGLKLALLGMLLLACGFIGGVLVEKGQTSSATASSASGLASRFAALRGAGAGAGTSSATGASAGGGSAGGFAGRLGGFGGAAGGATIGEVSYISHSTLYVTNAEGNTVKVSASPATSITKTVKADLHGIHPGETVVVRGSKRGSSVSAESISVSTGAAASGGGLGALFGGGSRASGSGDAGGSGGAGGGGGGGGGGSALFGK